LWTSTLMSKPQDVQLTYTQNYFKGVRSTSDIGFGTKLKGQYGLSSLTFFPASGRPGARGVGIQRLEDVQPVLSPGGRQGLDLQQPLGRCWLPSPRCWTAAAQHMQDPGIKPLWTTSLCFFYRCAGEKTLHRKISWESNYRYSCRVVVVG